jgi:glyoxylase-like metal-dependent hydrolase (beta-lactamase superfamily II)
MNDSPDLVSISPRVRVAVGAGGASNAAAVRLAEGVLLVDGLAGAEDGRRLRESVTAEFAAPISRVVLTHHHADHWAGLRDLTGAQIVAHPRTAALLADLAARHDLAADDELPFAALLETWVGRGAAGILGVDSPNGVVRRLRALAERDRPRMLLPAPIAPGTRLADEPGFTLDIEDLGPGHGHDDLVVRIVDDGVRILIAGDQAFFGRVPVVGAVPLDDWIMLSRRLADGVDIVVPGHGAPGDGSALAAQADYLCGLAGGAGDLPEAWSDERSRDWHEVNRALIESR